MANVVKQFRYYSDSNADTKSQPLNMTKEDLVGGNIFDEYFPILQLGVQSLPGVKFYLNNAAEPIVIGQTGIFELDLKAKTEISKLQFDYDSMNMINTNNNAYLIIDIIYDTGKEV